MPTPPPSAQAIQALIDGKTKPLGALGTLETLAKQLCTVQGTLQPALHKPTIVVFAADHGIAQSGVSAYPPAVTAQMVLNFLRGGAAINVFCRQHGIDLRIADAGVAYDFGTQPGLLDLKIAPGTRNFLEAPAMDAAQLADCFSKAECVVDEIAASSCNTIGFGEMGIGNTSSAALLMSALCDLPLDQCVGTGTGLDAEQLARKHALLAQAQAAHPKPSTAEEALQLFGGFEIAQMCGAMLRAHHHNMLVLVDGFIATAAYLCAYRMRPAIQSHAVFCHASPEQGHRRLLAELNAEPLLQLHMRLGEGTGCAMAYPIIESAVRFLREMASFEGAGVDGKV